MIVILRIITYARPAVPWRIWRDSQDFSVACRSLAAEILRIVFAHAVALCVGKCGKFLAEVVTHRKQFVSKCFDEKYTEEYTLIIGSQS